MLIALTACGQDTNPYKAVEVRIENGDTFMLYHPWQIGAMYGLAEERNQYKALSSKYEDVIYTKDHEIVQYKIQIMSYKADSAEYVRGATIIGDMYKDCNTERITAVECCDKRGRQLTRTRRLGIGGTIAGFLVGVVVTTYIGSKI